MKKLGVIKFGKALLESGDLDPIYIMLWKANLHQNKLKRWLLAYWWFYHAGVASMLSEYQGYDFYALALKLAKPESKTPRGTERRHFRGEACIKSITYFMKRYPKPEKAVKHVANIRAVNLKIDVNNILSFVKESWPLFGPWIGFKIADMLERLAIAKVKFPIDVLEMYSEPVKGAQLVIKRKKWDTTTSGVVTNLVKIFSEYKAPPRYERPVNAQEIETILCKWKSHLNGHYPVGKDTTEIREALKGWGRTAKKLRRCLP